MASISISAKQNVYTITMDNNDWTGLSVNGDQVPSNGNGWSYSGPGPLTFQASANDIETVAGNRILAVKGEGSKCYVAGLTFTAPEDPFVLAGSLFEADNVNEAADTQQMFTQGHLMGGFSAS